jgi:RNA polymerase sigma-70 factor (ECF subfamily)
VSLNDLDELTIVARAQDGDLEAFDWLITAYQRGVYRLCVRMLNDRSDAEDIVQETFIAAWRSLPNLTAPQAFVPWLYRTATNKCLDDLRRRQRRPSDPTADLDATEETTQPARQPTVGSARAENTLLRTGSGLSADPADVVEGRAQIRALADLLQTVPPGLRVCWLLREVHGFSYAEIAAIVQLPESTVRGRIARAKRSLAEGMEAWR